MARAHKPRAGSLQFWPRKRAKSIVPRIRSWPSCESVKPLGFAGYKVGMLHVIALDNTQNSPTKGQQIALPVTVIECPPLFVMGLRFYKNTVYGLKLISEMIADNLAKELDRKICMPKKKKQEIPQEFDDVKLLVHTMPYKTGIGKKKPEIFELAIGSKNKDEKLSYAKSVLGKEIKLSDVFNEGSYVDVHAVTKGKGFQGPVKRFGVSLKHHKSEKKRRSTGNLGSWTPTKVDWRVPQRGQMGFHTRTEYNKLVLAINPQDITPAGGFHKYGVVKNDVLLLKGSVPGARKRIIKLIDAIREPVKKEQYQITQIVK